MMQKMMASAWVLALGMCAAPLYGQVITTVAGGGWRAFPTSEVTAVAAPLGTVWSPALDSQGNLYFADSYNNIVVRLSPNGKLVLVAGNSHAGFSGDGGPANAAALNFPTGVAVDSAGNLYIADAGNYRIRKVSGGTITTVAGNGGAGFSGDGGPATSAAFNRPIAVALDGAGNLYIADEYNRRIRKVSAGTITTVAGGGNQGLGDGGPATSASLFDPSGIAVDSAGNLYIADTYNQRIRKVSGGNITTVAGNGNLGFSGDGGPATNASLNDPEGVAVDSAGNLYIADFGNNRIREVSGGIITTVVGSGNLGFSGDGGSAASASLNGPDGVAVDAAGELFIADFANERIRKVSGGVITTVAGTGGGTFWGDGGTATSAELLSTADVVVDATGNLYIADPGNNRVRKVSGGMITTVAGNGIAGFSGDGGLAASASLNLPQGVAVDSAGNLDIADCYNDRIRKVSGGTITTVAGSANGGFSGDGGPATSALLACPSGVAIDSAGNLYIADSWNSRIRKVSGGTITTIAGNGIVGFSGDGGPATSASLNLPVGVAVDSAGNLYISDRGNFRIRKVSGGIITTVAGNGVWGFSGDGGPATNASLAGPNGVAVDSAGNLYIADFGNNRVREVSGGTITTVAGNGYTGFWGDGGPAIGAALNSPEGVAVDLAGNLYIADTDNNRIREVLAAPAVFQVSPTTLTLSTTAGLPPGAQTIVLSSTIAGLSFSVATNATWLSVNPSSGSLPAILQVSVDPTSLTAGSYQGTITITVPNAVPSTVTVAVTLTVQPAAPAQLTLDTQSISFTATQGSSTLAQQLHVSNAGGGSLSFSAAASTSSGGSWLSVAPASGTATPSSPVSLTVTATTGALTPGTYSGTVAITAAGSTINLPVTLSVSAATAVILLSQSGLSFAAVAQGGVPLPQDFAILNIGQGVMSWSATATTLSGGNWLQITPTSGTVERPNLDVSLVSVSIVPGTLAAGTYYGQIQVAAAAVNTPQVLTVILTVVPEGQDLGPEVQPTGLIFTGVAGVTPGSQDVLVGNRKAQTDSFLSGSIGTGYSYLPTNADVQPNAPLTLRVYPNFSQLAPGEIEHGTITLQFSDGTPRTISLLFVVAPAEGANDTSAHLRGNQTTNGCSCSSNLLVLPTSLQQSFTATLGQAQTVAVQVVDQCGNLVGPGNTPGASVSAGFSNGDQPISLSPIGNGVWTGTWVPVQQSASAGVTVTAAEGCGSTGVTTMAGTLLAGNGTPVATAAGVVSAATGVAGAPIAPGSLISIYGLNLAEAGNSWQAPSLPLPTMQNNVQVQVGGVPVALLYISASQLNVQVPFDLPVNTQQQIALQYGNALSVPGSLVVAEAQPGIFTVNEQGTGQGIIVHQDYTLVEPGNPAQAGEVVTIFCTGLGQVSPAVAAGAAAPDSPLSETVNTVTVQMGGQNATVSYGGLAPGFAGLYQVNAKVPSGVSGDAVPVVLQVAGQASPAAVTMAVE
jgi:uncharacterized protein (TIGR03437 family)